MQGTARSRFIDADECGIELRDANRKYGHAVANLRVRQPGNYTKSTKLTVLLGIEAGDPSLPDDQEGSVAKPRRYIEVNQKPGTTSADYFDFVTEDDDDEQDSGSQCLPSEATLGVNIYIHIYYPYINIYECML